MPESPKNYPHLRSTLTIGQRVMVRRRLFPDEIAASAGTLDANRTLTDLVGTVLEVDDDTVVVETRAGSERVRLDAVVTAKALGPRAVRRGAPHRAVSVLDLEELMVDGWRPREAEWLGRWMLRTSDGYTGRANSCLVLGEPGRPLDEALDAVSEWYRSRGLAPLMQVAIAPGFDPDEDALVREAVDLGWQSFLPVRVMTASVAVVAQAGAQVSPHDDASTATVEVSPDLTEAWWALADDRARSFEDAARRILTASQDQRFLTATAGAETLAHARLALSPGWGGIFVLATREDARRRGLARRLITACAREAVAAGAASLYLQVAADNDGAIALYESLGFKTHHTYFYLRPAS